MVLCIGTSVSNNRVSRQVKFTVNVLAVTMKTMHKNEVSVLWECL